MPKLLARRIYQVACGYPMTTTPTVYATIRVQSGVGPPRADSHYFNLQL